MTDHQSRAKRGGVHLTADDLLALARSAGGSGRRGAERGHLTRCRECRRRYAAIEVLVRAGRAGRLEAVPERLQQAATRLFREWRESRTAEGGARIPGWHAVRETLGRLRLMHASMGRALAWASAPAGARQSSALARCELAGGGYRVELEWIPAGRSLVLRGRVTSRRPTAPEVRLFLEFPDSRPAPVAVGPRGFFGPVRGAGDRLRAELRAGSKRYRSGWLRPGRAAGARS